MTAQLSALLRDPEYLLDRVDWRRDRLLFTPTSGGVVRRLGFLDGRSDFATGTGIMASLSEALADAERPHPGPLRFLFHGSFCGSTLLARMLDQPGKALVLREPACLVDMANWKAALDDRNEQDERFAPMLKLVLALLGRPWRGGEPVVVKPSNWANNLIPEMSGYAGSAAVFVDMPLRDFLLALFRGGRDRLAYLSETAVHLATLDPRLQALVRAAVGSTPEAFGQVARLGVLAHQLQRALFLQAVETRPWGSGRLVSQEPGDPVAALRRTSDLLGLGLSEEEMTGNAAAHSGRDAKAPGLSYAADERAEMNRQLEGHHGARIDAAIDWGRDQLGGIESLMPDLFTRARTA